MLKKQESQLNKKLNSRENGAESFENLKSLLEDFPDEFDLQLFYLVKQSGLSVDDIALKIGVNRKTVYNWLDGRTAPKSLEVLLRFCFVLNLPPSVSLQLLKQNRVQIGNAKEDRILEILILNYYYLSFEEIEEILENYGIL